MTAMEKMPEVREQVCIHVLLSASVDDVGRTLYPEQVGIHEQYPTGPVWRRERPF